jgi:hypothetical protein
VKALLAALCVALLAAAAPALAYVAPGATIVSASLDRLEQGDDASGQPDVSAAGRYVVFRTAARNLFPDAIADPPGAYYAGGVYRRDLVSGALDLVALGDVRDGITDDVVSTGASAPSVSGDGRWVAFTTAAALVPADTNGASDVYVRDMNLPPSDPAAYELISARDGGDVPATYVKPDPDRPDRDPGADSSPGTAISDDGRTVAFAVREVGSDLPEHAAADVPAGQVFVRDRALKRTTLVTRVAGSDPPRPIDAGTGVLSGLGPVVLSADGSTVAWAGQTAGQQTRFLDGESSDPRTYYYLWRRVADGAAAPTRRITGASDPDDPACDGHFTPSFTAAGPCYGPLGDVEQSFGSIASFAPALSADGRRVAFLTPAPPRGLTTGTVPDLFVTDMSAGVSRKAATVELTRETTGRDPTDSAALTSVAMSEDGRWVAIVTQRTRFALPALSQLGDVRAKVGVDDLYLVDLSARTVERAVHAYTGGDIDAGVQTQVSLSADGRRMVFASGADDLFFGDANQRADVFAVDRLDSAPPAPADVEAPDEPAADPLPEPAPPPARLSVFVRRAPAGKVRLLVKAPAKGTLTVAVRGRAADADGVQRGAAKLLGTLKLKVKKKGNVTVDVAVAKRYRAGLKRAGTLDAEASLRLVPAKGSPLERTVAVRFKAPAARSTKK